MGKYNALFQPIKFGNVEVKNRIDMPAMVTNYGIDYEGIPSDKMIAYLVARARGGVGLITSEGCVPSIDGMNVSAMLRLDNDGQIPHFKKLTDAVHEAGAKVCLQLAHAGRQAEPLVNGGITYAPSPIPHTPTAQVPKEMTIEDIHQTVERFGECVERAQKAGFDMVEIHAGHGYLVHEFVSPWANKRTDEYGGSLENRARFLIEILEAARKRVGDDYPIVYRIGSNDFLPDGTTPQEAAEVARMLVDHGVNGISVTGGNYAAGHMISGPEDPFGIYVENAALIKRAIEGRVPVIVANRLRDPEYMNDIVANGTVDMVALGRPLLADESFVAKIKEGKEDEIRQCASCNFCVDCMFKAVGADLHCMHNPTVGFEFELEMDKKTDSPKKIVVVGGGPGGMEAAYLAKKMGHDDVVLFEKSGELGGTLISATKPPFKEVGVVTDYLMKMLEKYNVDVRLNTEATVDLIKQEKPDFVILATGSKPFIPDIPGVDGENVCTADDILMDRVEPGKRVLIVGGGSVGVETAEYAHNKGSEVTLIGRRGTLMNDLGPMAKIGLLMRSKGFMDARVGEAVKEIKGNTVITDKDTYDNVDTVILASGYRGYNPLEEDLKKAGIEAKVIGDAAEEKGRKVFEATNEAFFTVYNL